MLLTHLKHYLITLNKDMNEKDIESWLEGIFFFSVTWSIGACINSEGRVRFDKLLREIMDGPLSAESMERNGLIEKVIFLSFFLRKMYDEV